MLRRVLAVVVAASGSAAAVWLRAYQVGQHGGTVTIVRNGLRLRFPFSGLQVAGVVVHPWWASPAAAAVLVGSLGLAFVFWPRRT